MNLNQSGWLMVHVMSVLLLFCWNATAQQGAFPYAIGGGRRRGYQRDIDLSTSVGSAEVLMNDRWFKMGR